MMDQPVPETIGPYRIAHELGRGGFGTVYLAHQQEPLRRTVALKVLNPGRDSREILARFELEREVLELMDHPSIAKLLDAGVTPDGRPYYAMEFVRGVPLARYVERQRMELRPVLELFAAACDAVHHAHQKGVIHRDLSANNVLVSDLDGKLVPKIIDFGIAKLLSGPSADRPAHTVQGQVMGTLAYMSPEQVEGRIQDVDTRTDVYALGAQLYELVTGSLPFLPGRLVGADVVRIIREQEPERPSVRVRTAGFPRARDQAEVRQRSRLVRGDLEWIVGKAMAKDRDRRYATAAELSADVRRFLAGEPVLARPPSRGDRIAKFVRRHRATVSAAAAVFVILCVSFGVSLSLWLEAERHAERAIGNADAARAAAAAARDSQRREERALADFDRLKDEVVLNRLRTESLDLWPEIPERIGAFDAWFLRANRLVGRLQGHRDALAAMASDPADEDERFLRQRLDVLVGELEHFAFDDDGEVPSVGRRRNWASTVVAETVEAYEAAWVRAAGAVASDARFGDDFVLTPQVGLVPVGTDDHSRLQEFVLLRSGDVPTRVDGELRHTPATGIVFVLVPPTSGFPMGAQRDDPAADNHDPTAAPLDGPVHEVSLDAFFIAKFEVTQAQWRRLTGESPSAYRGDETGDGAMRPVESLSWETADEVFRHLGLLHPTEAQWEYACRAGSTTAWSTGSDARSLQGAANLADSAAKRAGETWPTLDGALVLDDGYVRHTTVGSLAANAFGMHDMHGNVREWCRDVLAYYSTAPRAGDGLRSHPKGRTHAFRGGGYYDPPDAAGSGRRQHLEFHFEGPDIGVRPVRGLDGAKR